MKKHSSLSFFSLLLLFTAPSFLLNAESVSLSFSAYTNQTYDPALMEVWKGNLRLSPTGSWNGTGSLSGYILPSNLYQDSQENLFYTCYQFMGSGGVIYKSSDSGTNWSSVYTGNYIHHIIESYDQRIFASTYGPLVTSIDFGDNWSGTGLTGYDMGGLMEDSRSNLWVAFIRNSFVPGYTSNYIFMSSNSAASWKYIYSETYGGWANVPLFNYLTELPDGLLAAYRHGMEQFPAGLNYSTNQGAGWVFLKETTNGLYSRVFYSTQDHYLYLNGTRGIARTPDIRQPLEVISTQQCGFLMESKDAVFYKTYISNVWKSFDRGETWIKTPLFTNSGQKYAYSIGSVLEARNGRFYAGAARDTSAGLVFESGFVTSATALLDLSPQKVNRYTSFEQSSALNGGNILFDFSYSTNSGAVWSPWAALSDSELGKIPCGGNGRDRLKIRVILFSSGDNRTPELSLVRINLNATAAEEALPAIQIAPNPFRFSAGINAVFFFNIPAWSEIKIYSLGGVLIAQTGNRSEIPGAVEWEPRGKDGRPLASGVYMVRVTSPGQAAKEFKLTLIR